MLDAILANKNSSLKTKLTVKTVVSIGIVALAVILPLIVHAAIGARGGAMLLPMYLPVVLGACLLGVKWGLCVGVLSPVVSFIFTAAAGEAMPAAVRLPYMIAELGVFSLVAGLFSGRIAANKFTVFPAVIFSVIAGRGAFLILAVIFQNVSPLSVSFVLEQIKTGIWGVLAIAVTVPLVVTVLCAVALKPDKCGKNNG